MVRQALFLLVTVLLCTDLASPALAGAPGAGVLALAPNHPPVALDDDFSNTILLVEDSTVFVALPVLANDSDPDPGDSIAVKAVTKEPAHGTAQVVDGTLQYRPNPNAAGTDTLTYSIRDGHGATAQANVTLFIRPVNDAPLCRAASATAVLGGQVSLDILAGCTDADGDTLSLTGVGQGAHGAVMREGTQAVYQSTDGNWTGTDSFVYIVRDGQSPSAGTFQGTARVTVVPSCGGMACADRARTTEDKPILIDVLSNDGYFQNRATLAGVDPPMHGSAVPQGGQVLYTPEPGSSGWDHFRYQVRNCSGGEGAADVWVEVLAVNYPPEAFDDWAVTPPSTYVAIDVLANDADVDGDRLTVGSVAQPMNGTVTHQGPYLIYHPNDGFAGTDVIAYEVHDRTSHDTGYLIVEVTDKIAEEEEEEPDDGAASAVTAPLRARPVQILSNDSYVAVLEKASESEDKGGWLQVFSAAGVFQWERELPAGTATLARLRYLWEDHLVCDLGTQGERATVLDGSTGTLLYHLDDDTRLFADRYAVSSYRVTDLESQDVLFGAGLQSGDVAFSLFIGSQVLFWDDMYDRPLLVSLPDGTKHWTEIEWDTGALEAFRALSSDRLSTRQTLPEDRSPWPDAPAVQSILDGFPILIPWRHDVEGGTRTDYFFVKQDGSALRLDADALAGPDADLGYMLSQNVWAGPEGPILLVGFEESDYRSPHTTFVALDGAGSPVGRLVVSGHSRYGVSRGGALIVLTAREPDVNPQAVMGDDIYTVSEYPLPGLRPGYQRDVPPLFQAEGLLLVGSQLIIPANMILVDGLLLGMDAGRSDSAVGYRFSPWWKDEKSWQDYYDPLAYNGTHLFFPQSLSARDAPLSYRLAILSRDSATWPIHASCQLTYPEPAYTRSAIQLVSSDCRLPYSLSVDGAPLSGNTWNTPDKPGTHTVTLTVGTGHESQPIELVDIARITDTDGDGLTDYDERYVGSLPGTADTDGDGVPDGQDLAPLFDTMDPAPAEWNDYQMPGMIRLEYMVNAYALDGRAKVYDVEYDGSKPYVWTCETGCTMDSDTSPGNVAATMETALAGPGFDVTAIQEVPPHLAGGGACDETPWVEKWSWTQEGSWPLYQTEYRFYWDETSHFFQVSAENKDKIHFPSDKSFYRYLLVPYEFYGGVDEWLTLQYKDAAVTRTMAYRDGEHYKLPAIQYVLYPSDQFAYNSNRPLWSGLAPAAQEGDDVYRVRIRFPSEVTDVGSPVLQITPVWVEMNGADGMTITPSPASLPLTGLQRQVILPSTSTRTRRTFTQRPGGLRGLGYAWPSLETLVTAGGQPSGPGVRSVSAEVGVISLVPGSGGTEAVVLFTEVFKATTDTLGSMGDSAELAEEVVKSKAALKSKDKKEIEELEKLPKGHWATKPRVRQAWAAVAIAGDVASLASDGYEVVAAVQEGDGIRATYYIGRVVGGTPGLVVDTAKLVSRVVKTPGKYPLLGTLTGKTAGKVVGAFDIALDAGAVGYDIYRAQETDNPFLRNYYYEQAAGGTIETAVTAVGVFFTPVKAAALTWDVVFEVYKFFAGEDLAYRVATNGFGIPFLWEYWSEDVPGETGKDAVDAMNKAFNEKLTTQNEEYAKGKRGYLSILVGPVP